MCVFLAGCKLQPPSNKSPSHPLRGSDLATDATSSHCSASAQPVWKVFPGGPGMHGESPANTLCFRRKHLYIQTKDVASRAMTYVNLSRTYCRNPEHATPFRSSVSWAFGFFNFLTTYFKWSLLCLKPTQMRPFSSAGSSVRSAGEAKGRGGKKTGMISVNMCNWNNGGCDCAPQ